MAKFKKGEVHNPHGRPPLSKEQRRIRSLSNEELSKVADLLFLSPRHVLQQILDDREAPAFECLTASIILKGIFTGTMGDVNELLNRLIGKVKDRIEHHGVSLTVIDILDDNGKKIGEKHLKAKLESESQ